MLRLLSYSGASLANLGAIASFFSGCAYRSVEKPSKYPDRYGLTILADGFRADLFKEMLDDGQLPNIKKHLVDRGTMVKNCITTFPSTTGPAHLAFINGCMPGNNNCPGLRWIDRKNNELRDYTSLEGLFLNSDFPKSNYTLYEMLANEITVSIFDFCNRGATDNYFISKTTLIGLSSSDSMEVWKNKIDKEAVDKFKEIFDTKDTLPKYTFVWLPALDHLSHIYGSTSDEVRDHAQDIDGLVGQIMGTLQKKGIYEKTLVSLVADHGLRDNDPLKSTKIRDTLTKYDFDVLKDLTGNDNYNTLLRYNAARAVSGDNFALLYFAKKEKYRILEYNDWANPVEYDDLRDFPVNEKRIDLIDFLKNEDAIKLVMAKEQVTAKEKDNVYRIFTKSGEGKIEREYPSLRLKYTVINGSDPLDYANNTDSVQLMDGNYHDKDEWFKATTGTDYPDAPFQISQLFDSERCGDIVISAQPGNDQEGGFDIMTIGEGIGDDRRRAGHGGIEKAEMMVPWVIAGPGISQGVEIERARTVDHYPTYLKFFGIPTIDGEVPNVFIK